MSPNSRAGRSGRRPFAIALEGLETRQLLTVIPLHRVASALTPRTVGTIRSMADVAAPNAPPLPSNQNPGVGDPSPAEQAKERITVGLLGTFQTTRGRFDNQPLQGLILATGGSNQSLHLNAQMQFFTYTIPGAVPSGQIALSPRHTATSGTILLLDLTSDGTSFSHGLPTHFTWTVDGNGSGGLYSGATGSGTLDVNYTYSKRPIGVNGLGKVSIKAQGAVITNHGITDSLVAPSNRPKNP